jgi:hypothetical protein
VTQDFVLRARSVAEGNDDSRLAVLEHALKYQSDTLKERMDLKFAANEEARALQFNEWMRRLGELNGEAQRLKSMQTEYYPRELAEGKIDAIEKSILALQIFQSNLIGKIAIVGAVTGLLFGIAAALVVKWIG